MSRYFELRKAVGIMKKPVVALVGRPNVGKSTLFNKLVGKKVSIIEDTPGITRDRIYGNVSYDGYNFHLLQSLLLILRS